MDLTATPAALNVANNPALDTGTAELIAQAPIPISMQNTTVKKPRTITRNGNSAKSSKPKNPATAKSAGKSSRLQIRATRKGSQESWTVATSTRPPNNGSRQTSFRVRVSDVGFRVCLVYYDDLDKRREPYLCYMSAREWQLAKRGTLASFAQMVTDKLTERGEKENADGKKRVPSARQLDILKTVSSWRAEGILRRRRVHSLPICFRRSLTCRSHSSTRGRISSKVAIPSKVSSTFPK